MGTLQYSQVRPAVAQSDLTTIAPYMFWLMFRNIASDGFVFGDPVNTGVLSQPGCVLASPSWENTATNVSQDYVYNWTRDAAIAAIELAAGPLPTTQPLIDYVRFAQTCQNSASSTGHLDRASFLINGTSRNWTDQTDGPALQTLAILRLYAQLDAPTQATANNPDRGEPGLPAGRLSGPDLQPVGGGVRRPAGRVVGLDADPSHTAMAAEFAAGRGLSSVEIMTADAMPGAEDLPGVFDRDLDGPSAGVSLDHLGGGGGGIGGDQGQVISGR